MLQILACLGALGIAAVLFWEPQPMRNIAIPIAIVVALASAIAASLVDNGPAKRAVATQARLDQAKWKWAVRIMRSNQMKDEPAAIDEAITATNEFVTDATGRP